MKIVYFKIDPETKIIYAGISYHGETHRCVVWSAGNCCYVHVGMKIAGTLSTLFFSPEQLEAFSRFLSSGVNAVEYERGIA